MTLKQPVFRQIVAVLEAKITSGDLPIHEALPSERSLAADFGVSRMTARRALEAVEASGLAYSKDRKGRFVSPPRLNYDLGSMADFLSGSAAGGLDIAVTLLSSTATTATPEQAALLEVPAGTEIYHNQRLFTRDGHPVFVEAESVVTRRCAALVKGGAQMPATELQRLRYSARGETADIVIRMQPIAAADAKWLGLNPEQSGILQEQRVRDADGRQFCYCRQVWRGELAQFSARAIVG